MVDREATAFAETLVNEKRILPAGKDAVAALFAMAVKDDNRENAVCFNTEGKINEGERVKNLRTLIDSLPQPAFAKSTGFGALDTNPAPKAEGEEIPISKGVLRHGGNN
jgi:hypothetical protein